MAERMADAGVGEEPPAAGLRAERQHARVGAVQRDAEREREIALECRRREGHEVAELGIGDARADRREDARALQQLRRERPRRAVVGGDQVQAARACDGMTPGRSER